ncbi:hypothetical protein [Helicobacter sp. T3_23-1059]
MNKYKILFMVNAINTYLLANMSPQTRESNSAQNLSTSKKTLSRLSTKFLSLRAKMQVTNECRRIFAWQSMILEIFRAHALNIPKITNPPPSPLVLREGEILCHCERICQNPRGNLLIIFCHIEV